MSLVRPVCEYGSVAWSPYTKKDIICFESVQRRAARFVCNDYCRSSSVNAKSFIELGLARSWTHHRLENVFEDKDRKCTDIFPKRPARGALSPYLTRGSAQHPFQFQRYSSTINAHKYSFFVRTVPAWNALSPLSVSCFRTC